MRSVLRECLQDVQMIKHEIGITPIRVKRRDNPSLNDHQLDRPAWEKLFQDEYGAETLSYVKRHSGVWIAMGHVKPLFLRQQYTTEVSPSGRLGIRTLISAIEKYRDFNELKFRV